MILFTQELKGLYIGLDIGQKNDRTVFSLLEKWQEYGHDDFIGKNPVGKPYYKLVYFDRFNIGIPMPQQIDRVKMTYERIVEKYNQSDDNKPIIKPTLAMDLGWVGKALFDQFCQIKSADYGWVDVYGINFLRDGTTVTRDGKIYGVPKKDLTSSLAVVMENDRLNIPSNINDRAEIISQLAKFTWKISQSGNLTAENLKDSDHDDIPCSLMMAVWFAETVNRGFDYEQMKAATAIRNML